MNIYQHPTRGWIFYDGHCALCVATMRRVRRLFESRGYHWVPLQTPGSAARLAVPVSAFDTRMHLLTPNGLVAHNADALAILCRSVWWLWPLGALLWLPPIRQLGRLGYDWLARNRYCLGGQCEVRPQHPRKSTWAAWTPVALLPLLAGTLAWHLPPWALMWALAFALFAGCKWMTFHATTAPGNKSDLKRRLGYLFAWPGMDAQSFFKERPSAAATPPALWGVLNVMTGALLVWGVVPLLIVQWPLLAGWTGMIGIVLILHFGLFALLASAWQRSGVAVTPVMREPLAATSLADFWGRRWNTAFHELVHRYVFRPMLRHTGVPVAFLMAFALSGLVHDFVISLPAQGGFGLPTFYFLVQGFGILFERTAMARRLGLGRGPAGWLFTMAITAGPAFLLFHPPFMNKVILPFLRALGA